MDWSLDGLVAEKCCESIYFVSSGSCGVTGVSAAALRRCGVAALQSGSTGGSLIGLHGVANRKQRIPIRRQRSAPTVMAGTRRCPNRITL